MNEHESSRRVPGPIVVAILLAVVAGIGFTIYAMIT